ncbi:MULTISPECIES: nitrilase-related carbon-nitrogen hydrolase [unclassified Moraxella]|uniref:nitrilase-related carbon-nitrogen hydrolase n=1 Tax=unclassified Moraxella TaxID=2685852 RepID=UPI003AF52632
MSTPNFNIAIVELNSQTDIMANLICIEQGVALASHAGAKLVVLPENAFGFGNQSAISRYFEPLSDWCGALARHYHVHLLAGTMPCQFRPNGQKVADDKLRQVSLLFDPAGDCVARYDKIHLFKATVNDSTGSYDEGQTFEAGDTPVVAHTALGNIGMMVCFDIRFPTLAIKLREMGADILTAPSAFTYATGKAHWQSLLTARALDSQCLVVGAGQTGRHGIVKNTQSQQTPLKETQFQEVQFRKTQFTATQFTATQFRETWGHSLFTNANGEVLTPTPVSFNQLPQLFITDFSQDFADVLPIANQAKSWIPPSDCYHFLPMLPSVLLSAWDNSAQQQWRQQIDLQQCQRFGIVNPLS